MRRPLQLGLAAAVVLLPVLGLAQVSIGLRAAYAIPMGDALGGQAIGQSFKESDLYQGAIPVQVEAAWRFTPSLSAGLYASYGYGLKGSQLKDFCDQPGASCPAPADWRYGVQAAYSFGRQGPVEPWAGVGAGMQIAHFKVKGFTTQVPNPFPPPALVPFTGDLSGTLRGWEVNFQAGADWRLATQLLAGPYLQFGVGQYRVQDITLGALGTVASGGVDSPQTHEWVTIGVRGRFDL
jgi:opacity protein-like surface antigen